MNESKQSGSLEVQSNATKKMATVEDGDSNAADMLHSPHMRQATDPELGTVNESFNPTGEVFEQPGDNSIPSIFITVEEDANVEKEIADVLSEDNLNHLSPTNKDDKQKSRPASRVSSAMSFISVASSRFSNRLYLDTNNAMCHKSLGLILAFLSGILMTAYSSMIKMLDHMDSMQVVVIRGVLQLVVMGAISVYKKLSFTGPKERFIPLLLFLVSLTGGLRLLFIFTSFSRLPLGDSTTIVFSSPVLVMVFSICILKEHCGLFRIVAGISLLTGVVLIAKPPILFGGNMENYDLIGYTLVSLACFMSAIGIVLTKKISKKIEKTVILFYLGLASAICGGIGLFSLGTPSNPAMWEWGTSLGIGVLGLMQQYCLIYAVTLESPSRVMIVRQMQIVFAYVVQIVMFDTMPKWTDLLGAGLVLATVMLITLERQVSSLVARILGRNTKSVEDDGVFKEDGNPKKVGKQVEEPKHG